MNTTGTAGWIYAVQAAFFGLFTIGCLVDFGLQLRLLAGVGGCALFAAFAWIAWGAEDTAPPLVGWLILAGTYVGIAIMGMWMDARMWMVGLELAIAALAAGRAATVAGVHA